MILDKIIKTKRFFNVANKKDVAMYTYFLQNASWGGEGCPFILEEPFLTIPDMIKDKLVHKFLKVERRD
jgi:hypothetical protein